MKTKIDKFFEKFHSEFWKALKDENAHEQDIYFKFKSRVLKLLGKYENRIKQKDEIIQNQVNEIASQKFEIYLYKSLLKDAREKLDGFDLEFMGYDKYKFESNDVKLYRNLPPSFDLKEFKELTLTKVGGDSEDAESYLWKYQEYHLISKRSDGSYVKLLETVPEDLNEIDFIKERIAI